MKNSKLFEGAALVAALAATSGVVKLLADGAPTRKITPALALNLIRAGSYRGYGSAQRIRHIRQVETRRPNAPDPKYWLDRGCIRFHGPIDLSLPCYGQD